MKVLLSEMTWLEIQERLKRTDIVLVPVGSIEQHGLHLPLDTDILYAFEVAKRAAEAVANDVACVVAPPICFGYSEHHIDFPGTISLRPETLLSLVFDVCRSLIHHGFKKIVIVNGHGGNIPILNIVARRVKDELKGLVIVFSYWSLATEAVKKIRESEPGGIAHACEFETSLALTLRPELINKDMIRREIPKSRLSYERIDLFTESKISIPWNTREISQTGVIGDPTKATKEKGEIILNTIIQELTKFLRELKSI
ncbi:MAG: creatininase family protein [Candidatus Methanomethylicia archaeon]